MPNFFNKYPYTDFHELNLDWILEQIKRIITEWAETITEWHGIENEFADLKNYVEHYFEDPHFQEAVNAALQDMYDAGLLDDVFGAIISGLTDTGGDEPPYPGGNVPVPTTSGKTTKDLAAILASQNCRSEFYRCVNVGSIYSWAKGNVSGNYSARQCFAECPQGVNVGSEECQTYGFQSGNYSSHYSQCDVHGANFASRLCFVSGFHSSNISSVSSNAGGGHGARFDVEVTNGQITSITILDGGSGYSNNVAYEFADRLSPDGTGASVNIVLTSGVVTAVNITDQGHDYSDRVDLYLKDSGEYSSNIASGSSNTYAPNSANIATYDCTTSGSAAYNANVAGRKSSVSGRSAGTFATNETAVEGNYSAAVSANSSSVVGELSAAIIANNSEVNATGSLVLGRRTINSENRSIAFGDASSGSASTANRKAHLHSNGNLDLAGAVNINTVFNDFAEYLKNGTGKEIPVGTIVTIDRNGVRPADKSDDVIGVISGTAGIICGDTQFCWNKRYLTDEFGRIVTDNEGNYIENPEFDITIENIPRSKRPDEWSCVGMIGQVYVRIDDSVSIGSYLMADKGIGQRCPARTNLLCIDIPTAYDPVKGYGVALCILK